MSANASKIVQSDGVLLVYFLSGTPVRLYILGFERVSKHPFDFRSDSNRCSYLITRSISGPIRTAVIKLITPVRFPKSRLERL